MHPLAPQARGERMPQVIPAGATRFSLAACDFSFLTCAGKAAPNGFGVNARSAVCRIDSGLLVCYGRRHVRAFPRADTRTTRLPLSRGFGTNPGNPDPLAR